jgi:hypothetical protein
MVMYEKFYVYRYEKMGLIINEQNKITCNSLFDILINE